MTADYPVAATLSTPSAVEATLSSMRRVKLIEPPGIRVSPPSGQKVLISLPWPCGEHMAYCVIFSTALQRVMRAPEKLATSGGAIHKGADPAAT